MCVSIENSRCAAINRFNNVNDSLAIIKLPTFWLILIQFAHAELQVVIGWVLAIVLLGLVKAFIAPKL